MKETLFFVSSLVPDTPEFSGKAFARSGNNACQGLADGLKKYYDSCELISCRPIASYPQESKIFIKSENVRLNENQTIHILPTFNIKGVKNILWGVSLFNLLLKWRIKNKKRHAKLLVYNICNPPMAMVYLICKLLNISFYVLFFDLGIPPKSLNLSTYTRLCYHIVESPVKMLMKRLAGRIIINERMVERYAPSSDYLLVDGAVNNDITNRLFPLEISTKRETVFLCAGMLWSQNGTRLILEMMKINKSKQFTVWFAGTGIDVELIKNAAVADPRIKYLGMLTTDELFEKYKESDVLLNLRIEEPGDMHFPSKLFEYMATGKYVVSTDIAHARRDYGEYVEFLDEINPEHLSHLMDKLIGMDKKEMYKKGLKARK